MKCRICGKSTDWDSSNGYTEFIVCNNCVNKLASFQSKNYESVMKFIFECGEIRQKNRKEK